MELFQSRSAGDTAGRKVGMRIVCVDYSDFRLRSVDRTTKSSRKRSAAMSRNSSSIRGGCGMIEEQVFHFLVVPCSS